MRKCRPQRSRQAQGLDFQPIRAGARMSSRRRDRSRTTMPAAHSGIRNASNPGTRDRPKGCARLSCEEHASHAQRVCRKTLTGDVSSWRIYGCPGLSRAVSRGLSRSLRLGGLMDVPVSSPVSSEDLSSICQYVQQQRALGSERFKDAIERQLARRARPGIPGRGRKLRCSVVSKMELSTLPHLQLTRLLQLESVAEDQLGRIQLGAGEGGAAALAPRNQNLAG